MAANITTPRSVFFESTGFRIAFSVAEFFTPQVNDRAAARVRLEGPDISLSGRQILLKLLN